VQKVIKLTINWWLLHKYREGCFLTFSV